MSNPVWQPESPLNCVIFDCDGTLSSIEGIDQLALTSDRYEEVARLTSEAMGKVGINPTLYKKRLDLVNPTPESLNLLTACYIQNCVPDTAEVIQLLKRLHKSIYIVSAGLYPSVAAFGQFLKIPAENIFAVKIEFDAAGNFLDYDYTSPLTHNGGKHEIVAELKKSNPNIAYVGDGLNDLIVKDLVSRFIGYGGIYYRENIEAASDFYIKSISMTALLPLVLTQNERATLSDQEITLYEKGLQEMTRGNVSIHAGS